MTTIRRTWRKDLSTNDISLNRAASNYLFATGSNLGMEKAKAALLAGTVLETPLAVYHRPDVDVTRTLKE